MTWDFTDKSTNFFSIIHSKLEYSYASTVFKINLSNVYTSKTVVKVAFGSIRKKYQLLSISQNGPKNN